MGSSRRQARSAAGVTAAVIALTALSSVADAGQAPVGPSLLITKAASQIGVEAGGAVTFEIEVTNTGDTALTGVTVTDAAAPDCDRTIGALAIGRTDRYECSYVTTAGDVGTYTNTATANSDQTAPVSSQAVDTTVTVGDGPASVEYTCNNPNPLDNTPIVSSFDISLFDDVDPAEPGETVTWSLDVTQPSLGELPFDFTVNWLRLTVPRPANLSNVQLNLSDPPGATANPATDLTTTTVNPNDLVIQTPNNGQKIVGKTDGSLIFPENTNNPVVLPRVSFSADPTQAARGTDIQWKPPVLVVNGSLGFFNVTVTCNPTDSNVTLVSTRVNPAQAALDVDKDSVQAAVTEGDDIDFSIEVENTGNVPLTGLDLADAAAPGCAGPLPDLAPGASEEVTCTYTTSNSDVGIYRNTASVIATEVGPVASNPVGVVVDELVGVLDVSVDAPATAVAGADVPITVDVGNTGAAALTGVTLAVPGAPGCDGPLGTIAPAGSVPVTCDADATQALADYAKGGTLELTATADAVEVDPVASLTASVAVTLPPSPWPDVAPWYAEAADWMAYWTLADGYPDGTYQGGNDITRAALARMVYRFAGAPDTSTFDQSPFSDMVAWAADAQRWVAHDPDGAGPRGPLMTGEAGAFNPDQPITRAQVIRLFYRFAGQQDVSALPPSPFPDTPLWVQDAVRWAAADLDGAGPLEPLITGTAGMLRPNDPITRAETTRLLYRLCEWLETQP